MDKPSVWSNDNDFFEDRSSTNDDGAADCEWMGPTSEVVYGHHRVAVSWFADVQETIDGSRPRAELTLRS